LSGGYRRGRFNDGRRGTSGTHTETMTREELTRLLGNIHNVRAGILGDFCLDAYLLLDSNASEASLETGLSTRPVRSQRYSPGGAGNVACNLQAMGVKSIALYGVIGADPFGDEMKKILGSHLLDTSGLLVQREKWDTHVYMKPFEKEKEQQRLDFGSFNQLHPATLRQLLERLSGALSGLDIVILKEQVAQGVHTRDVREALSALATMNPGTTFITDSRHFPDDYAGTCRRLGLREAARIARSTLSSPDYPDPGEVEEICRKLFIRWGAPLFVTRPDQGCVLFDREGLHEVPGLLILSPVDTAGAGDSMLSGIAAALAAGANPLAAAELGSLVAGVTAQKLMQTGTASPEEILLLGTDTDRRYRPELARQRRRAVYAAGTEIEIVSGLPRGNHFTHIIFDHDGTLSTLRQGWEEIMEPMMVRCILGDRDADESLYDHVVAAVRDYIDRTTGIQTLVQMHGLVQLVKRFRCVPEEEILDPPGYKSLYNAELLAMVRGRIERIQKGELGIEDFTIRMAREFLETLHAKNVKLYLASGTDQEDLERESAILGYRALFGDRIYGAVGDVTKEAKRLVLERILSDIGGEAPGRTLAFGDGPVEIRETHKKGGYSVGVASDEVRRYGLNTRKRRRLIEAGADIVIPDFCQMNRLLPLLFDG
jgi:bifunctional ADP-heptose synthase (sugar kinase/adenylyltransferase)/phosphoglycolate phosphatase-like HAD superfamily hydrolase